MDQAIGETIAGRNRLHQGLNVHVGEVVVDVEILRTGQKA
jgi:hypothetical protein